MKNILIALCLIATLARAVETPENELKRIDAISVALQTGGVEGLLATARSNGWSCPRMPSKWHVENRCPSNEWRKVLTGARDLGFALAVALDGEAPDFQMLSAGDELDRRATRLCDLSEWCAATTGYGNVMIAQRSLDLAAVGLARLTADLNYPLASCEKLAARMRPDWMSVAARAAVFNNEAGAKLFSGNEPPEELERMLGTGKYWLKLSQGWKVPLGWRTAPPSRYADRKLFEENLDFFAFVDDDSARPHTVVAQWDCQRYFRISNGLELQTIRKAMPLVEFRRVVGAFPEKVVRTSEEIRETEEAIAFYAKQGVKVTKDEDSPYYSPMKEAFKQAWRKQPNLPIDRYNDSSPAFQAYDEVRRRCFLDQDTINARLFKDRQDRQEVISRKMDESRAARARAATNAVSRP